MEALNERLHVEMDTDEESCGDSSSNGTNLRRSNSAPMIHLLGISENGPSYSYEQLKRPKPRARTYSATYNQRQSPVPMTLSICVNSGDRSSHAGTVSVFSFQDIKRSRNRRLKAVIVD